MKFKFVPNVISILRIAFSLSLLFIDLFSWKFVFIYLLCGMSDALDGYIARRTKTQSIFGAKLDTTADIVMFAVILYIFIPVITLSNRITIWLLTILLIRIISIIIVYLKYKVFAMLHTYSNKITGLLLFFVPIAIGSSLEISIIYFVCFIASVSAVEELAINILSKSMELDIKSIFALLSAR